MKSCYLACWLTKGLTISAILLLNIYSSWAADGVSVKPGINREYTNANLNVERWVKSFESESREIFTHRQQILETVGLKPGMEVADVGAGSGLFTRLFSDAVGLKGTVYAVDIAPPFLKHIREQAEAAGLKNIKTVQCTDRSAELPANSVDRVFISDTYHHFEHPAQTMASIHRALRRGGELVVVEFRRMPGVSRAWILGHVRAGQEEFTREIEAAGFQKIAQYDFLKENYILKFKKVLKPAK